MKGWFGAQYRHALAAKGILTKQEQPSKSKEEKIDFSQIKDRAIQLIDEAEKELNKFEETKNYIHYAQATEKAWQAYKHYLAYKSKKIHVKAPNIEKESEKLNLKETFGKAKLLHNLSFGGDYLPYASDIKPLIIKIKEKIRGDST